MQIAVLNKSDKLADRNCDVVLMATACSRQLRRHACPAWNRAPASVVFCTDDTLIPPGAHPIYLFDKSDQADALGYHDETPDGVVYGRVFIDPVIDAGGEVLTGAWSVSSVLSHEVLELFGDPNCNLWATANDGYDYALELGDPVEADSYDINVSGHVVSVSNFVLPEWFDDFPPEGSKFDYLGKLTAAFSMTPGGYVIYKDSGTVKQKFGAAYPEWKKATKGHAAARSARRSPVGLVTGR